MVASLMRCLVPLLLLAGLLGGCEKPTVEQCDKGCRNYFQLHYWAEADRAVAAAPVEIRSGLRALWQADFPWREVYQLPLCTQKCRSGADPHRAKCWGEARTVADSEKCAND